MSLQRRADTQPELMVRSLLHGLGLRYRVNYPLPGIPRRSADIMFTRVHLAVFIDGCFWHCCPEHASSPNTNREWWTAKLVANVERDRATDDHLRSRGWAVLRFWEHQDPTQVAADIAIAYTEAAKGPHGSEGTSRT